MSEILLDPRTNEPYIDENGNLVLIEDEQSVGKQAFQVWASGHWDLMVQDYGLDLGKILRFPFPQIGYDKLIEVELKKMLNQEKEKILGVVLQDVYVDSANRRLICHVLLELPSRALTPVTMQINGA